MVTDEEVLARFQQQLDELRKDYNEISFENLKLRAAIKKLKGESDMFIGVKTLKANQYVILFKDKTIFQSYDTIVAFIDKTDQMGDVLYYTPKKYSKTTSKYFNIFKQLYHYSGIFEVCDEDKFKEKLNEL